MSFIHVLTMCFLSHVFLAMKIPLLKRMNIFVCVCVLFWMWSAWGIILISTRMRSAIRQTCAGPKIILKLTTAGQWRTAMYSVSASAKWNITKDDKFSEKNNLREIQHIKKKKMHQETRLIGHFITLDIWAFLIKVRRNTVTDYLWAITLRFFFSD